MNSSPSYQRSPLVRVSHRNRCKICGHSNWCSFTEDGHLAFCMRTAAGSFKEAANGAYLHRLTDVSPPAQPVKKPKQTNMQTVPRASVEHRDAVYTALLYSYLVLAKEHEAKLLARGLDPATIRASGYASTPPPAYAANVARALAPMNLEGVPGFYREGGEWQIRDLPRGFFVPVRDEQGRMQGLQIRLDVPFGKTKYLWFSTGPDITNNAGRIKYPEGTSSGAPAHYAKPHLLRSAQEVTITEGALKADVIAYLTATPVIGFAGVSCFSSDFATRLRETFPNLRRVAIAYDRDLLEKKEVYGALLRLTALLEQARFQVRIRTWPGSAKGYDDYLLEQLTRREVAA